ncbi:MAG: pyrroline-5-carboxylate reductase [Campylobacter sp.]|nr:pyrroline-5-carboxylate reductase [Campylobacter sp.]
MKIGFIGGGNMASAMISAITSSKFAETGEIFVYDRSKNENLKFKFCITPLNNEQEVVKKTDIVVLAVKPNGYENVLKSIKKEVKNQIILTLAPNFSIEAVGKILGYDKKIVRTMPNMPAAIGEGVTAVCFNENFSDSERAKVLKILQSFGKFYELQEDMMPVFTAIAGSLPAYVFMFIEALADGAVLEGMPKNKAYEIIAESVVGSANMLLKTNKNPATLKDEVCSPKGTTIEAVRVLEERGFRASLINAVSAAAKKAADKSE